jgi:hypothetical protein
MLVRHWLGDLALAILLALPLTALARQPAVQPTANARPAMSIASADRAPQGRIGLFG